jgi:hypothetical protein
VKPSFRLKKAERTVPGDWRITSRAGRDADYLDIEDFTGQFQFGLARGVE